MRIRLSKIKQPGECAGAQRAVCACVLSPKCHATRPRMLPCRQRYARRVAEERAKLGWVPPPAPQPSSHCYKVHLCWVSARGMMVAAAAWELGLRYVPIEH